MIHTRPTRHRLTVASALLAAVSLLAGCGAEPPAERAERTAPITVEPARSETVQVVERSIGQLQSKASPLVAAEVAARVQKVNVDVGARVAAGAELVQLDAEDFRLALTAATAEVNRLVALIRSHERQVERLRDMSREHFVGESQLEEAEAQLQALREQLGAARAARSQAERDLARSRVLAPVAGEIAERHIAPGDFVQRGDPLFRVTTVQRLQAILPFPETVAARLRPGLQVELWTPPAPGEVATGTVTEISPNVNPASRNLNVIVELDNPGSWRPGATVRARVVLEERANAVTVPELSVVRRPAGTVVYVIENGKAVARSVEVGVQQDGRVELLSGIQPGEPVAVEGAGFLTDAASVQVTGEG